MVPCKGGPAPGRQWTAIGIRRVRRQRWCSSWGWGWWRVGPAVWGADMCSGSELYHATQHRGPSLHLSPTKLRSGSTRMYTHAYKHTVFRQCMVWNKNDRTHRIRWSFSVLSIFSQILPWAPITFIMSHHLPFLWLEDAVPHCSLWVNTKSFFMLPSPSCRFVRMLKFKCTLK